MSKTTSKSKPSKSKPSGIDPHLDDKIAAVASKTVQGLRRNQILLLSALGGVLAIVLIASGVQALKEQELNELAARDHALLSSLKSRDADVVASIPEINDLLTAARGTPVEKPTYRRATEYLLAHSRMALFPRATPPPTPGLAVQPPAADSEPETTLDKSKVPEVLESAKKIVAEAQKLFPNDTDVQNWATESLKRIEALRELGRESTAPERGFSPPLPDASK